MIMNAKIYGMDPAESVIFLFLINEYPAEQSIQILYETAPPSWFVFRVGD